MDDNEILMYLETAGLKGHTWKELQTVIHKHHGTISGCLSNLHAQRMIYRTKKKRKDCAVYIHAMYKNEVPKEMIVEKPRTSRANQLLNQIVLAFDKGVDLTSLINEARGLVQ